ncbi:MAG: hypothetical protein U5L00_05470 [Desulfovermiculus sp.]|nr:hypothetical protein [Desulfovermiculus sp.]
MVPVDVLLRKQFLSFYIAEVNISGFVCAPGQSFGLRYRRDPREFMAGKHLAATLAKGGSEAIGSIDNLYFIFNVLAST